MPRVRLALVALVAACSPATADVSLNNMFGSHMVLQQGIRTKVWGKADPGEAVSVALGGQTHSTTATPDGMWHVFLDPIQEYGGPHTLIVKGKNTVTFDDVLIGEVWVLRRPVEHAVEREPVERSGHREGGGEIPESIRRPPSRWRMKSAAMR